MTLALRPARPTDAGKLAAMLSEAIRSRPWKPRLYTAAEEIAFVADLIDRGWVTVAEDGAPRGFIARDGGFIHALYVGSGAQGRGVGAALLADAMARCDRLELYTFLANDGAQRFYRRAGFREAGRSDGARNEERLPDIRFVWERSVA